MAGGLGQKWNGLPVWAWVGLGGAGLAGTFVFVRGLRRKDPAASAPPASGPVQAYDPLVIPLAGPPGARGYEGDPGARGATGATGATGAAGAPGPPIRLPRPTPAPTPAPIPPPAAIPGPPTTRPYDVVQGDTLWGIAERYLGGQGTRWRDIYGLNEDVIRTAAEQHGLWNPSDPGHWIFPGEHLLLPAS